MKKAQKSFSQAGFTIVQAMIGLGLASAMSLMFMRMNRNQTVSMQGMKASADFIEISNYIQSKFYKKDYCKASFADNDVVESGYTGDSGRVFAINVHPTEETKVAINNLVKPIYAMVDGVNTLQNGPHTPEYIIPADVNEDDPKSGLQYGNVSLMSMNLVRLPNSDDVFLELNFQKRLKTALGGKHLSKRIPLQVIFKSDGITFDSCFSDFNNLVETARKEMCEVSFHGQYDNDGNPLTPDCTDIAIEEQICTNSFIGLYDYDEATDTHSCVSTQAERQVCETVLGGQYAISGDPTIPDCTNTNIEREVCENTLGGTYTDDGDPTTNDCSQTQEFCELRKEVLLLKGENVSEILCGNTFTISDADHFLTSGSAHTIASNYVRSTLSVAILGGGGGGGCGRNYGGEGGGRGSQVGNIGVGNSRTSGGDRITYTIGSGGAGGGKCGNGGVGNPTTVTVDGTSSTAGGGTRGRERCDGCRHGGESVSFAGGRYRQNNNGLPGRTGAGGAGGEGAILRAERGGAGGSGAVWIRYKIVRDFPNS